MRANGGASAEKSARFSPINAREKASALGNIKGNKQELLKFGERFYDSGKGCASLRVMVTAGNGIVLDGLKFLKYQEYKNIVYVASIH